jgi:HK97 family phage major capsid protein
MPTTTKTKLLTEINSAQEFRALTPDDQLRALRGRKVERAFVVEREGIDTEARTVWMSIASDTPYMRWWGEEILDITSSAIIAERLKNGAPLLVGHDVADQVGVVEDYEITSDRKLRVLARFSRSARAEEIWQDVLDGIRRNTSVGYLIHDLVLEAQKDGVDSYRVTSWEPYEGSLVPVPADATVGVGRSLAAIENKITKQQLTQEKTMPMPTENTAAPAMDAAALIRAEQTRINAILSTGDEFRAHGGVEIARELIKEQNATVETLRSRLADKLRATPATPLATAQPAAQPTDNSQRILINYGKSRAFKRDLVFSDGSVMKAEEAAYRAGKWVAAVVYGNESARKWCAERGISAQRVMSEGVNSNGGFLVPTEMEPAVIQLRDEYGVSRQLARVRQMGSNSRNIPRRTGGITAYFVNEDNSGVTASDKGWDNVSLNAKTLAALGIMSKDYQEDAIIDVADDFAQEIALAFATKEDECFLNGDGTSTYGGMQGLVTKFEATAYASRVDAASGHDTAAEIDGSDLANTMGAVRKFAKAGAVWLCSSTFEDVIFGRLKAAGGGNTITDLAGRPMPSYLGYPIITSESMLAAVTAQNDKVMALFGNFGMSSSFGDRRGITVEILRERYAEKLQIGIIASERFDIVNHDLGSTTVKGPVAALLGTT